MAIGKDRSRRMLKKPVQQGRKEFRRRGVQGKYVEAPKFLRTKLAGFFSILNQSASKATLKCSSASLHACGEVRLSHSRRYCFCPSVRSCLIWCVRPCKG